MPPIFRRLLRNILFAIIFRALPSIYRPQFWKIKSQNTRPKRLTPHMEYKMDPQLPTTPPRQLRRGRQICLRPSPSPSHHHKRVHKGAFQGASRIQNEGVIRREDPEDRMARKKGRAKAAGDRDMSKGGISWNLLCCTACSKAPL